MKREINWEDAPEWAQWLAQDRSGVWHWFADRPAPYDSIKIWASETTGHFQLAGCSRSFRWRQSLQKRDGSLL